MTQLLIGAARKRIWIANAYFVPSRYVLVRSDGSRIAATENQAWEGVPGLAFWGPALTIPLLERVITGGGDVRRDDNIDDAAFRALLVVDVPRKTLLLWGGSSLSCEIPARRAFLQMVDVTWGGWQVRWAHDGEYALLRHFGLSEQQVDDYFRTCATEIVPADVVRFSACPTHFSFSVVSFRNEDGHVVLTTRTGHPWNTTDNGSEQAPILWPGWTLVSWEDRVEEHQALVPGRIVLDWEPIPALCLVRRGLSSIRGGDRSPAKRGRPDHRRSRWQHVKAV